MELVPGLEQLMVTISFLNTNRNLASAGAGGGGGGGRVHASKCILGSFVSLFYQSAGDWLQFSSRH